MCSPVKPIFLRQVKHRFFLGVVLMVSSDSGSDRVGVVLEDAGRSERGVAPKSPPISTAQAVGVCMCGCAWCDTTHTAN